MIPYWSIWIGVGIIFIIIEIFTFGFVFSSFGLGMIFAGLSAYIFPQNLIVQILVFILSSFVIFLTSQKWSKKFISKSSAETNVDALIGKIGIVTKAISKNEKGYVKVGGEIWSAISKNGVSLEKETSVEVLEIEGNKLVVKIKE
jgi:membrane protein implicated in regulation of membrane protease activity